MDGAGLSQRERAILAAIEKDLRADAGLDRHLRTMRPGPPFRGAPSGFRRHPLAGGTCLCGAVTATLLVMAASSSSPALIWAFAGTWVLTLVGLLLLVCRWSQRLVAGAYAGDVAGDGGASRDGGRADDELG
ncbi:DUF3040 domain-containing protein [Streptomyces sp. ISL-10]|uniref:DUF3040 domain-containing protein n=1 Tax=Streptomyces sp. ISL-10 TaxID=2819172 RepID=UPI001BEC5A59|nr:DUF3040 domain-containing protein [Streptomyces sp. ISL-10]MBT2367422.1 DUF3040 domain-containing protein [Streptomyces sp. ISL-10]